MAMNFTLTFDMHNFIVSSFLCAEISAILLLYMLKLHNIFDKRRTHCHERAGGSWRQPTYGLKDFFSTDTAPAALYCLLQRL